MSKRKDGKMRGKYTMKIKNPAPRGGVLEEGKLTILGKRRKRRGIYPP